jgi:hypothetical protein
MIAVYAAMNRIIWVIAEVLFGLVGMVQKQRLQSDQPEDKDIAKLKSEAEKQVEEIPSTSKRPDVLESK